MQLPLGAWEERPGSSYLMDFTRSNLDLTKAMQLEGHAFARMTNVVYTEVNPHTCHETGPETVDASLGHASG